MVDIGCNGIRRIRVTVTDHGISVESGKNRTGVVRDWGKAE